jgi:hypothetical protein
MAISLPQHHFLFLATRIIFKYFTSSIGFHWNLRMDLTAYSEGRLTIPESSAREREPKTGFYVPLNSFI